MKGKTMRRAMFVLTTIGTMALVAGCSKKVATEVTKEAPPVSVQSVEVGEGVFPKTIPLTGSLRGESHSDLAAGTTGRLVKVSFERGSHVKKGDVLAVVDVRQAQIAAAEATVSAALAKEQLASTTRDCARTKTLFEKGALSQAEYDRTSDQCRNAALQARAADYRSTQAGHTLQDGWIRAPFAGTIAERTIDVGEFVRADSRIGTLVTNDALRLEFSTPEALLGAVKAGDKVSFQVPSQPGKQFEATVTRTGIAVREATRDVPFEASVDNSARVLLPGMFAEVRLQTGTETLPSIPPTAIVERDKKKYVYVIENGRANLRIVSAGAEENGRVGILRGLRKGERAIVSPKADLPNGAAVTL